MGRATRRELLKLGIGAAQYALLAGTGLHCLGSNRARASGARPTKLVTIYLYGGWMPSMFFCPLSNDAINRFVPPKERWGNEPAFFEPDEVRNVDGSGNAPDPDDERFQRIRLVHQWDASQLDAGLEDRRWEHPSFATSPNGYAWKHYEVFRKSLVIHGIDQQTAAHRSGMVSSMCGVAGSRYKSPAMHAWVAAAHATAFPERPLGAVNIGSAPSPAHLDLGAGAVPTRLGSIGSLVDTLSERQNRAWGGLRDRSEVPIRSYDGETESLLTANAMEEFALRRTRELRGRGSAATDAFYEELFETYSTVSRQLGADLVATLEATPGWESPYPFYNFGTATPWGVKVGPADVSESGGAWNDQFELTLKLLKSDLCSAISVRSYGAAGFNFDTHQGFTGPRDQCVHGRMVFEQLGRFLAELDATPGSGGGSLLDETLVVAFSDFARTWPHGGVCDHWPITSTILAGGGIAGNRMIGNYLFSESGRDTQDPLGAPIDLIDEGRAPQRRAPTSLDVVYTAMQVMGVPEQLDFFLPGGPGEIVGVRR